MLISTILSQFSSNGISRLARALTLFAACSTALIAYASQTVRAESSPANGGISAARNTSGDVLRSRAMCYVMVEFLFNYNGSTDKIYAAGTLWDSSGIVLLSPVDMPAFSRASSFSDFRVYYKGCKIGGLKARYLGSDAISELHFVKIEDPLPRELLPVKNLPLAELKTADRTFGFNLETFGGAALRANYLESYVSNTFGGAHKKIQLASGVSIGAGAVFASDGAFAGIAVHNVFEKALLHAEDGMPIPVSIERPTNNLVFAAADIPEIVGRIPKTPNTDICGWIGVANTGVIKADAAEAMGLENAATRAYISVGDIFKNSPAAAAGIKSGDIITDINGVPFERFEAEFQSLEDFSARIKKLAPNSSAEFGVFDGAKRRAVRVNIATSPTRLPYSKTHYFEKFGFSIRELTMEDSAELRILDSSARGAVVEYVRENGAANENESAALSADERILEVNSLPVKSYAAAVAVLQKAESDSGEAVILTENLDGTKLVKIKAKK